MSSEDPTLLWHYVDYWAARNPQGDALVFGQTRLTWAQFRERVNRTAEAFLELGVEPGDRIAIVSTPRPEFLITFMAASKIRAIWLGISPKLSLDELRYVAGNAQPSLLITVNAYAGVDLIGRALTLQQEFPSIAEVLVIGESPEDVPEFHAFTTHARSGWGDLLAQRAAESSDEDEALLMYTSGATGKPKGVLHTHQTVMLNAAIEAEHFRLDATSRFLLHFPINHVAADVEIGYASVLAGAAIIFMEHFEADASLDLITREAITILGQVPTMYIMQIQSPRFAQMDWRNIRTFVWGGAGAPAPVLDALRDIARRTGARIVTGYGSTELCGFVTFATSHDGQDRLAGSVGKSVPPYELRIVGPDRQTLPNGQIGELAFRGPVVMKGYLNAPGLTAEVIDDDGWYYTRDLGSMDDDGFIYLSGRSSEMYKSGGENVFPREIEDVLNTHPAVLYAAVLGVPDPVFGEVGHAFIMFKQGQSAEPEALHDFCLEHLANFKVPKHFSIRTQLPLLPSGKVNKSLLR